MNATGGRKRLATIWLQKHDTWCQAGRGEHGGQILGAPRLTTAARARVRGRPRSF